MVLADDAEINGATASTYTLTDADAGKAIKVRVSFTDDAGNDGAGPWFTVTGGCDQRRRARWRRLLLLPTPRPPGVPTITGTARVGETLTADTTGISDGDGLNNAALPTSGWPTTPRSMGQPLPPIL